MLQIHTRRMKFVKLQVFFIMRSRDARCSRLGQFKFNTKALAYFASIVEHHHWKRYLNQIMDKLYIQYNYISPLYGMAWLGKSSSSMRRIVIGRKRCRRFRELSRILDLLPYWHLAEISLFVSSVAISSSADTSHLSRRKFAFLRIHRVCVCVLQGVFTESVL